jgi:general secretion pathway protein A
MRTKALLTILTMLSMTLFAYALSEAAYEKRAKLLAEFLHTGRVTVAHSLGKFKINDANIGDKGFTAQYFADTINANYKKSTGIDIAAGSGDVDAETLKLLKQLLQASKKVANDNMMLINTQGLGFKGFIPASYGRQVSDIFFAESGIKLKQTTDKLRNEYNKPDSFEAGVIGKMKSGAVAKNKIIFTKDGSNFRLMRPIYIKKGCLPCHGDPKGSIDVAGRQREGYKVGELRGAISVTIPAK